MQLATNGVLRSALGARRSGGLQIMTDRNDAWEESTAEGDRWKSDSETVERAERNAAPHEEVVRRSGDQRNDTPPRRYEQPTEDDPVRPTADSSLEPKV
jgi:hypothetical protein